jgi:hypothetical protein
MSSPLGIKLRQAQKTLEMRRVRLTGVQTTTGAQDKAQKAENSLKVRRMRPDRVSEEEGRFVDGLGQFHQALVGHIPTGCQQDGM